MKRVQNKLKVSLFLLLTWIGIGVHAQQNIKINGTVFEAGRQPLVGATIFLPEFKIAAVTDLDGHYRLNNVPQGKVRFQVKYLGKQDVDTLIIVKGDVKLDFTLSDENFRLKDVVVTAQNKNSGQSTASYLNRNAIDHLQSTSLADVLALTPGAISNNQDLNSAKTITIRGIDGGTGSAMNSLGTAVISDGAPLSNNANLSSLNPSLNGSASSMAGGAAANTGVDARGISTDNIESVELIRGIPSVEYGDLTSGAVILHTKAGREPLKINVKANPNVYQGSVETGFELGKHAGALNISGDYAYNNNDVTATYRSYQRVNAKALYSNSFFQNHLRSNTSLSFNYGNDRQKQNPDAMRDLYRGEEAGIRFNTNGLLQFDKGWLQNLRYVVQGSYTSKQSMTEEEESAANSVYSGTYTDGTVLSNQVGKHVYDADGNEITHFSDADVAAGYYAHYLSNGYVTHNEIDSREVNFYAKLTANFFKSFGKVNNGLLLGTDFKADGNEGDGTKWSIENPPYRSVSNIDGSYRPRRYKDIPYVKTLGIFAEDNFKWDIGRRSLDIQLGARYDHTSVVGGTLSPRFNASFDIIPEILSVRGGYGITAKMPTLFYLYPQNAYFEYVNLNELANENIPEADRTLITTTRVVDTQNRDLKIAKNYKSEIGFDLTLGKTQLSVTGYSERLRNGYGMGYTLNSFFPFTYNTYGRDANGNIALTGSYPVLSSYYMPVNNLRLDTKGLEFEFNTGRIESIRTSFQLSGAWMESKNKTVSPLFYDESGSTPSSRRDIAIYSPDRQQSYEKQFVTTLRATHNIPNIGFVVTLTAQAVWNQSDWTTYNNDSIPIGYLSLKDGSVNYFGDGQFKTVQDVKDAGYSYMVRNASHTAAIKETVSPYFQFNINITKEIGDIARISFFANNFFRSYPRKESKRYPGTYYTYNNKFYFGMDLSLKL